MEPISLRLILVRHAQDADNARSMINGRRDTPLTELGKSQALALAARFRPAQIDCVYTSPLQRARETAAIISRTLDISDLCVEPDLIERDYGILTGRSVSEIPALAEDVVVFHDFKYVIRADGVEDYAHLWTRAGVVLRKIQQRHAGQTVLVVAHHEILRMMRANAISRSWEQELRFPPIANCEPLTLDVES